MPFILFNIALFIIALIYMLVISSSTKSDYNWHMTTKCCYKDGIDLLLEDFPTITFESFISFYSLNPSSWELMDYRVRKDKYDMFSYVFSYKEWKKYNKWRKAIKAKKKKQDQIKRNLEELQRKKLVLEQQGRISILLTQEIQRDIEKISKNLQPVKNITKDPTLQIKAELDKDICLMLYPSERNNIH